jgi:Flp pilus assembly protein TadG
MRKNDRRPPARLQAGNYAIEFSIVFVILFTMLYAIVCYAIFFTVRFSLQNAAEDGARAALAYQTTWPNRKTAAESLTRARVPSWLTIASDGVVAKRCQVQASGQSNCDSPTCGTAWEARCQVVVTITATQLRSLLPPLPPFAVPDTIVGQASMLLDGRTP